MVYWTISKCHSLCMCFGWNLCEIYSNESNNRFSLHVNEFRYNLSWMYLSFRKTMIQKHMIIWAVSNSSTNNVCPTLHPSKRTSFRPLILVIHPFVWLSVTLLRAIYQIWHSNCEKFSKTFTYIGRQMAAILVVTEYCLEYWLINPLHIWCIHESPEIFDFRFLALLAKLCPYDGWKMFTIGGFQPISHTWSGQSLQKRLIFLSLGQISALSWPKLDAILPFLTLYLIFSQYISYVVYVH